MDFDTCNDFYNRMKLFTKQKIEILIDNEVPCWETKDLRLAQSYDDLDQRVFSAFSPHLDILKNSNNTNLIKRRALSLILLTNGSFFITDLSLINKVFARYIVINKTRESLWSETIEEYPFFKDENFYDKDCFKYKDTPLSAVLFELSKIDKIIRTLLFLVGLIHHEGYSFEYNILNWGNLYKIYDTINYGCRKIDIKISELIPKSKIEAVTAACNNMGVIDINARHGLSTKFEKPPKNAIKDLEEAIFVILCLCKNFVIRYIKKIYNIDTFFEGNVSCDINNFKKGSVFGIVSNDLYKLDEEEIIET
jgi:hypothetical protein